MRKYLLVSMILMTGLTFLSWKSNRYSKIIPENNEIKIAIKKVSDGRPHYYKITKDEREIKFFLLMSDDGIVRAAFDACDVCFPEKKGYAQDGDYMICNNCGQAFHETKINVIKGGCNPAPIDRIFDQQFIYISMTSMEQGLSYF